MSDCALCGGSGFAGRGSGYDSVCPECGGQSKGTTSERAEGSEARPQSDGERTLSQPSMAQILDDALDEICGGPGKLELLLTKHLGERNKAMSARDNEPEFEMLIHVLIAQTRIMDASEWCTKGKPTQEKLREAYHALEDVKLSCSLENQRLADMNVAASVNLDKPWERR